MGSIPGLDRSPGGGNGNPPVFLPGEFHGQRSLAGYGPWGHKELDMTEATWQAHSVNSIHVSVGNEERVFPQKPDFSLH